MMVDDNNKCAPGFAKLSGINKNNMISRKERLKKEKSKVKALMLNDKLEAKLEKKITRLSKKVKS